MIIEYDYEDIKRLLMKKLGVGTGNITLDKITDKWLVYIRPERLE